MIAHRQTRPTRPSSADAVRREALTDGGRKRGDDEWFDGKVAVVTGAGSGIGAATAKRFLRENASVVLYGHDEAKLSSTLSGIDAERCLIVEGDVLDAAASSEMGSAAIRRFGRIDVLVNVADTVPMGPYAAISAEDWSARMRVNVDGHILRNTRRPNAYTRGSRHDHQRFVGVRNRRSLEHERVQRGEGAVTNLTRSLALELGEQGVRVNAGPELT